MHGKNAALILSPFFSSYFIHILDISFRFCDMVENGNVHLYFAFVSTIVVFLVVMIGLVVLLLFVLHLKLP